MIRSPFCLLACGHSLELVSNYAALSHPRLSRSLFPPAFPISILHFA